MGNPPFEDVSPVKHGDFSIAMLVYQRVRARVVLKKGAFQSWTRHLLEWTFLWDQPSVDTGHTPRRSPCWVMFSTFVCQQIIPKPRKLHHWKLKMEKTFSYTFRMYFPIGNVGDFPAIRHVSFQGGYLSRSKYSDSSPWCTPARKGNAPHGAEPSSVRLIDEKGLFLEYPPRNLLGGYVQITQKGIFLVYDDMMVSSLNFCWRLFRNFGL